MMKCRKLEGMRAALAAAALVLGAPAAFAEQAVDWQFGFQSAASPVRDHIDALHNEILIIITVITLFVLGLLLFVMFRFSAKRNPVPSKTTHNRVLEVVWTGVPVVILLIIAVPSFKLMYYMDRTPKADMTLKVTGHQWYWSYEYTDQDKLSFDSNMIPEDQQVKNGQPRLLEVDNPVVLPVGATVRILVTGTDVIHSWFLPSMGVQEYAVVGRTNESWMMVERPGTYYGQCNQICGLNHPFMPIEIKAVSKEDFSTWLGEAKKKFARDDSGEPVRLANQSAK
jgi:cytochrome c oxidase subunit II